MEILLYTAMVLGGMIVYYFEYTPVPENVSKKELWRYGIGNGIIGTSLIIAGVVGLFCEDHIYSYVDKLNWFWSTIAIASSLAACFFLPWLVRIVKRSIIHRRTDKRK